MREEMRNKIELCYGIGKDFPDGEWWALCNEHGVALEDLEEYCMEINAKQKAKES